MAGLDSPAPLPIPSERDQLRALAEMRWAAFARLMRNDNEKISFAFWLTGRILIFVVAVAVAFICGLLTDLATDGGPLSLTMIFLLVGGLWQGMALLREQQSGVELELLRFPLRLRTYIGLWLAAGALESMTILGTLACVGLFTGLVLGGANPLRAASAVFLYFVFNLALARNVMLWMGRLLARRRTRELVLVLFSIFGVLPRMLHTVWKQAIAWIHRLPLPSFVYTALHYTPPVLTAHTAFGKGGILIPLAGLLAWDAVLVSALIIGLRRSYRGEHLHEFAAASAPTRLARTATSTLSTSQASNPVFVVAHMEWARLRHGGAALYGTLTPLIYVAFFGLRLARSSVGAWTLPIAAAYLALTLRAYNVFGADGPGVQTFMLLPIPLRLVLAGKNLFAACIYLAQLIVAAVLVDVVAHKLSGPALAFTAVWATCHMAVNFAMGNIRSLKGPARVVQDRTVLKGSRGTGGGGWLALAAMLSAATVGAGIVALAMGLDQPWLAPAAMLPFTAAAIVWYRRALASPQLNGDIAAMEPLSRIVARSA
jgi:ABC-2 type transport system permease protein